MFYRIKTFIAKLLFNDVLLETKTKGYNVGYRRGYQLGHKEGGYQLGYDEGEKLGYYKGFGNGSKGGLYLNQYGVFICDDKGTMKPLTMSKEFNLWDV